MAAAGLGVGAKEKPVDVGPPKGDELAREDPNVGAVPNAERIGWLVVAAGAGAPFVEPLTLVAPTSSLALRLASMADRSRL